MSTTHHHKPEVAARTAEVVREYGPFAGAERIHGVSHDGERVWAATGASLLAFDPASGQTVPGEYVTGWAKRGPTGVIGTNRPDANETIDSLLADLPTLTPAPEPDPAAVERLLRQIADEGKADAFFTCGSNRLMLLMQRLGRELGIPGEVALEQQMACGIGMCFCCVRNFRSGNEVVSRRVCCEGPVFRLDEAMSW